MKFGKNKIEKNGYLLLESLATLCILLAVVLILYPLLSHWFLLKDTEKKRIEQSRILYEQSYYWEPNGRKQNKVINNQYEVIYNQHSITVKGSKEHVQIKLYEIYLE